MCRKAHSKNFRGQFKAALLYFPPKLDLLSIMETTKTQGKYFNFKEVKSLLIDAVDTDILDRLADLEDFSDHNGFNEELFYIQGTLDKVLNDEETNACTRDKIQELYNQMREGNYEYLILIR